MAYGKVKEWFTSLGCRVVQIRTVARKDFIDIEGQNQGTLLTPVEHIFLSCENEAEGEECS